MVAGIKSIRHPSMDAAKQPIQTVKTLIKSVKRPKETKKKQSKIKSHHLVDQCRKSRQRQCSYFIQIVYR